MVKLVGILNITPDSFSDGGAYSNPAVAFAHADALFEDGASLVDVGAESTRPGAEPIDPYEEWRRLEPLLTALLAFRPGRISVDTYHPETADSALALGDVIINDVTGMNNPEMREVVAGRKARCIISHLPGLDIQAAHKGRLVDDISVVRNDLLQKVALLGDAGLPADRIILDPGIGFGKTPALNWRLLEFAREVPNHQVMIGYSRKRFLGEDRMQLAPNVRAGRIAAKAGAAYLRVHDVAGHYALTHPRALR
ncbi:MAG TPA: dihydropteroate synthase [Candidatus Saccharimonadales bacterium]|nr:dihydropteroate synthase [Candidatus Saccharimonadales bacterium]